MSRRELPLAVLVFGLLSVLWTWPLATNLATGVAFDPRFSTPDTAPAWGALWELDWVRTALSELRTPYRTERAFWPGGSGLARQDLAVPWALLSWPLAHFRGDIFALNALLLGLFVFSATAMFGLARALGVSRSGALVAGFGWAFAPWFVQRGSEGVLLGLAPWPPLLAWLAWSWGQASTARVRCTRAATLGAVLGLAALTSIVAFAWLVPLAPFFVWIGRRTIDRSVPHRSAGASDLGAVLLAGLVGLAISSPLALELARGSTSTRLRTDTAAHESVGSSVAWADFVTPPGLHPLFAGHPTTRLGSARPLTTDERARVRSENAGLYLGVGLTTLFALGLAASASARALALLGLLGLLLTRDPGGLVSKAIGALPGFEALSVSALWLPLATLALALGAGLGFDALVRRPRGRAAAAVLTALIAAESWVGPWTLAGAEVPDFVHAIQRSPGNGAVLTLPLSAGPHIAEAWAVQHGHPIAYRWLDHGEVGRSLSWHSRAPDLDLLVRSIDAPEPAWPAPQGLSFDPRRSRRRSRIRCDGRRAGRTATAARCDGALGTRGQRARLGLVVPQRTTRSALIQPRRPRRVSEGGASSAMRSRPARNATVMFDRSSRPLSIAS